MLHTVNKSPYQDVALESCLRFVQPGDALLLFEDGVYGAAAGSGKSSLVEGAMKQKVEVYALSADLKARAVKDLVAGVKITDYAGFVDLVERHKVHSWL